VKKRLRNEKFKCMHAACALASLIDFGRLSLGVTRVVPGDARQNKRIEIEIQNNKRLSIFFTQTNKTPLFCYKLMYCSNYLFLFHSLTDPGSTQPVHVLGLCGTAPKLIGCFSIVQTKQFILIPSFSILLVYPVELLPCFFLLCT
jgi:hypothetical protein